MNFESNDLECRYTFRFSAISGQRCSVSPGIVASVNESISNETPRTDYLLLLLLITATLLLFECVKHTAKLFFSFFFFNLSLNIPHARSSHKTGTLPGYNRKFNIEFVGIVFGKLNDLSVLFIGVQRDRATLKETSVVRAFSDLWHTYRVLRGRAICSSDGTGSNSSEKKGNTFCEIS